MKFGSLLSLIATSQAADATAAKPKTLSMEIGFKPKAINTSQGKIDSFVSPNQDLVSLLAEQNDSDVDVTRELLDFQDQQIFTTMYLGTNHESFTFIFDTGSPWTWVDSRVCINCPNVPLYDERSSDYFRMDPERKIYQLNYGSGNVLGAQISDQLCLEPGACTDQYNLLLIVKQKGLGGIQSSGLIGLAPRKITNNDLTDLFIDRLMETGAIDKAEFSLYIGKDDAPSRITFGGYDLNQYATGPLNWYDVDQSAIHWAIPMQGLQFKVGSKNVLMGSGRNLVVDSGTSLIFLPQKDYYEFFDMIKKEHNFQCFEQHLYTCMCDDDTYKQWPDLKFVLNDGKEYHVPRETYVDKGDYVCSVKLMSIPNLDHWILGLNFFHNYYTVFDQQNQKVGIAPSITAEPRIKNELEQQQQSLISVTEEGNEVEKHALISVPKVQTGKKDIFTSALTFFAMFAAGVLSICLTFVAVVIYWASKKENKIKEKQNSFEDSTKSETNKQPI